MKYRKLGRTGFEVSEMAHGLWGMSGWTGSDDKESLAALQLAVDMGCNFFDTAWAYGMARAMVCWVKSCRETQILPTRPSACTPLPKFRQ